MKKLSIKLFALALLGIFTVMSCGDNTHAEKAKDNMEQATDEMAKTMEKEKNDLQAEIRNAQSNIDRKMEKLQADMKDASDEAKAKMSEQMAELKAAKEKLAQDLANFGDKTEKEWDQFKSNVKATLKDIGDDNNR